MDLKQFPEEIMTRILRYNFGNTSRIFSEQKLPHVNIPKYTKEALDFAVKPGNAELLCKTLQGRLILRADTINPDMFFGYLAPHLEELIIESFSQEFIFRRTSQCTSLRRLELKEFPAQFDWNSLPEGLEEIYVTVESTGQMAVIGKALRRLQLRELGIRYGSAMDHDATKVHREVELVCSQIAPSLKHLKKICIEKIEHLGTTTTSTWDIIKHFPAVEHVVDTEAPTDKAMELLLTKEFVSLKIANMDLVCSFGEKVVSIDVLHLSNESSFTAKDIAKLYACKNLTVLRAKVLAGAETQLHELPIGIKEVDLQFIPGIKLQSGHPKHSMESVVTITTGSILNFLSGAQLLSGLCIYGAKVDKKEIKQTLKVLGDRLLKFGVSVDTQSDSLLFVEEILDFIGQKNPNLKELNMDCEIFRVWEGLGVSQQAWVGQERLERLEKCLAKFHISVPGAQVLYLLSLLRRLVRANV